MPRPILALSTLSCLLALVVAACDLPDEPVTTAAAADELGNGTSNHRAELFERLNQERAAFGLEPLVWSPALTVVAETHVRDLEAHRPIEPCSLHSWSGQGRWRGCCYLRDAPDTGCMFDKPAELSGYPGRGYEIAVEVFHGDRALTPERALKAWRDSPAHHAVIVNAGDWAQVRWQAVGVALSQHYAVVWFGKVPDPASRGVAQSDAAP